MIHLARFGVAAALLSVAFACKPPAADPSVAADSASRRLAAQDRAAFRAGFMEGAAMPAAAEQAGLRPVRPSFARSTDELDPATGLIRWDLSARRGDTKTQGIVEGFAWASAGHAGHQDPIPAPLPPAEFQPWSNDGALVQKGGWSVALNQRDGILFWVSRFQGFEPIRGWRDLSAAGPLRGLTMTETALWIAGDHAVWALDIRTSALRAVLPPVKVASPASDAGGGALDVRAKAEQGDISAMLVVGEFEEQNGDYSQAVRWYRSAAGRGDVKAMEHLAAMAALGRGEPSGKQEAECWLERACAAGDPDAAGLLDALEHPEKLQSPRP